MRNVRWSERFPQTGWSECEECGERARNDAKLEVEKMQRIQFVLAYNVLRCGTD